MGVGSGLAVRPSGRGWPDIAGESLRLPAEWALQFLRPCEQALGLQNDLKTTNYCVFMSRGLAPFSRPSVWRGPTSPAKASAYRRNGLCHSFDLASKLSASGMTKPHRYRDEAFLSMRSVADSNRCTRFCRPLPNHSANRP